MAPALVEVQRPAVNFADKGIADYKEAYIGGPRAYKQDAEVRGTANQPPARYPNYLPTWDPEKKWVNLCWEIFRSLSHKHIDTHLSNLSSIRSMARMRIQKFHVF